MTDTPHTIRIRIRPRWYTDVLIYFLVLLGVQNFQVFNSRLWRRVLFKMEVIKEGHS